MRFELKTKKRNKEREEQDDNDRGKKKRMNLVRSRNTKSILLQKSQNLASSLAKTWPSKPESEPKAKPNRSSKERVRPHQNDS